MKCYQKLCFFRLLSIFHQIWIENEHWKSQTYIFAILIDIRKIIKIDDVIGIAQYLTDKKISYIFTYFHEQMRFYYFLCFASALSDIVSKKMAYL